MTPEKIKELVLENRELELSKFIELLQSIDNTNDGIIVEEYDCAIELNFSGINTFIHAFVSDEICENEAWQYWHDNFNPNPDDCCNLRQSDLTENDE